MSAHHPVKVTDLEYPGETKLNSSVASLLPSQLCFGNTGVTCNSKFVRGSMFGHVRESCRCKLLRYRGYNLE